MTSTRERHPLTEGEDTDPGRADDKKEDEKGGKSRPESCCCCVIPRRYIVVSALSMGMFIMHAMRVNIAVTVVTILDKEPHNKVGTVQAMSNLPDVMWDPGMIGLLHSVFYMGYLATQVPGGYLSTFLPSHRLFGGVVLCSGTLNMLLPVAIDNGSFGFTCAIRVIQGLFEGMLYPTCYDVMRHWTIPDERSRMGSIVLAGVYLGPMVGLTVSGSIAHYFGWQYVFFLHGAGALVWFVFWLFVAYHKPSDHPHMTEKELTMIEEAQGVTAVIYKHDKIPWKAIFISMPVHALNICNFARNWVFYLMLTNEPMYLNTFGFSLAQNGFYSAIPHLLMAAVAIGSGPLADVMIQDLMLSRTQVRKMFTGIGFGGEAICMVILGFTVSGVPALVYLTIGLGVSGLSVSGWQINHLDLAPRYASVLVAISTTVGTIAGIMIPLITGVLTKNMTIEGWQQVFLLSAAILVIALLFYTFFGSGETQPWAEPRPHVEILPTNGPLEDGKKPYGTFHAQVDHSETSCAVQKNDQSEDSTYPPLDGTALRPLSEFISRDQSEDEIDKDDECNM